MRFVLPSGLGGGGPPRAQPKWAACKNYKFNYKLHAGYYEAA